MSMNEERRHNYEELGDEALASRAKNGDREAFGELVRRHRSKVYGYARSIAQESALAEDIVQDALVKAFLHIGSLVDIGRFLPWLHRIVRNQAYAKLRSGAAVRERAFSSLRPHDLGEAPEERWDDLDYILHRLERSERPLDAESDPEARLARLELLETIAGLLRCLNARERQVFEAHFFGHLSPQEIGRMFSMTNANVYQILSRSRKKIAQQRLREIVDQYVKNRKDRGQMKKKILPKTDTLVHSGAWTSAAYAMRSILSYTESKPSLADVMGYSGHAFRICIGPEEVHIAGPTSYDFEKVLKAGLRHLGYTSKAVAEMNRTTGQNANLLDPSLLAPEAKNKRELRHKLPEALELVHASIDRGLPVLAWDLSIPEFGVIYGYDDEKKELHAAECGKSFTLPYDHLGRGIVEELFVLSVTGETEEAEPARLRCALSAILDHYYGREERHGNMVSGLAAYDTWIEAFKGGKIEPNGHAYNVAVIQEARELAAEFLRGLAGRQGESEADDRIRALSGEASVLYGRIAEELKRLKTAFPFPAGGDPNEAGCAERFVPVLETVRSLEDQAAALLDEMYRKLREA